MVEGRYSCIKVELCDICWTSRELEGMHTSSNRKFCARFETHMKVSIDINYLEHMNYQSPLRINNFGLIHAYLGLFYV